MSFDSKLKDHPVKVIELTIAKALSELVGEPLECSIDTVKHAGVFRTLMRVEIRPEFKEVFGEQLNE